MTRLQRTDDWDEIQRLNMALVGSSLSTWQLWDSIWWLAVDSGGDSAGFCGVRPDHEGGWGYLIRAGVCPDARGQGLQRRMIRTRLTWLRRHSKIKRAITDTIPENIASSNNLIKCGFLLYHPAYPWVGTEGVLYWMRKI